MPSFIETISIKLFKAKIANHLNESDLARLSQTSQTMFKTCEPMLKAKKLLKHVVLGEQSEAEQMIRKNPGLLFIRAETIDFSGRMIQATAFQAALGAEDTRMWRMMIPYFENDDAIRNQFKQQFPDGFNNNPDENLQICYNELIKAIIEDSDNGHKALEEFKADIQTNQKVVQGKHFNMRHLVAAYQAYTSHYLSLGTEANRKLYFVKVIGLLQKEMPAHYAQAYCSGLMSLEADPESFERTLLCKFSDLHFYLHENGLGENIGFVSQAWACPVEVYCERCDGSFDNTKTIINSLYQSNEEQLMDLAQHLGLIESSYPTLMR